MLSNDLKRQVLFLQEAEKLKTIFRVNKTLDGRAETSAEHSWHVVLMSMVLAQYSDTQIDLLKVTKMLIVHDFVEIDAGDTWLYESDQSSKKERERLAADRLFSILPEEQAIEFHLLWCEFELRETAEAKFASSVDGIQPLLNHIFTGNPTNEMISVEKVRLKKKYIQEFTPRLWPLVEELIATSVQKGLYG